MTRKLFSFAGTVELAADPSSNGNLYKVAMLVGGGTYNGLLVSTEELTKAVASFDKQPLNIDHSPSVEDEVGFIDNPMVQGDVLRAVMHLNPSTPKYATAKAYIENRFAAGKVPEVSVGFYCDDPGEDGLVRNMAGDHLSLVTRGACSPEDGAGVGLARKEPENMNDKDKAAAAAAADELLVGEPLKGVVGIDVHEKALADLKADYEAKLTQLAKSHEDADAELRAYKAHEFAGLKNEAVTLGLAVSEKDTIEGLKVRLSDAKAVIAKVPKAPEQTTATRHTKPNMDGETRRSELDNLMAHSGRSSA